MVVAILPYTVSDTHNKWSVIPRWFVHLSSPEFLCAQRDQMSGTHRPHLGLLLGQKVKGQVSGSKQMAI